MESLRCFETRKARNPATRDKLTGAVALIDKGIQPTVHFLHLEIHLIALWRTELSIIRLLKTTDLQLSRWRRGLERTEKREGTHQKHQLYPADQRTLRRIHKNNDLWHHGSRLSVDRHPHWVLVRPELRELSYFRWREGHWAYSRHRKEFDGVLRSCQKRLLGRWFIRPPH